MVSYYILIFNARMELILDSFLGSMSTFGPVGFLTQNLIGHLVSCHKIITKVSLVFFLRVYCTKNSVDACKSIQGKKQLDEIEMLFLRYLDSMSSMLHRFYYRFTNITISKMYHYCIIYVMISVGRPN